MFTYEHSIRLILLGLTFAIRKSFNLRINIIIWSVINVWEFDLPVKLIKT